MSRDEGDSVVGMWLRWFVRRGIGLLVCDEGVRFVGMWVNLVGDFLKFVFKFTIYNYLYLFGIKFYFLLMVFIKV